MPARPTATMVGVALLLLMLTAAILVRPGEDGQLQLANPVGDRVAEVQAQLDALPSARPLVLVGMDPDLGTYPEIRPATRAAFDALLRSGARLAFVSYSAEGRAISVAEQSRLRAAGVLPGDLLDLGFVSGSEAGMVRSVTDLLPSAADGPLAAAVRSAGGGMAAFSLALLIGGTEIGPRTWVEQVDTRLPALPLVAIAPTFAQPELQPYLRSGQLTGLLATARDDAAFVEAVMRDDPRSGPSALEAPPSAAAILIGCLVALAVLLITVVRREDRGQMAADR